MSRRCTLRAAALAVAALAPLADRAADVENARYTKMAGEGSLSVDSVGNDAPTASDLFLGRYSTRLPLAVPPNRGGRTPALALVYGSRSGDGPFGVGWEASLNSIERNTRPLSWSGDDYVLRAPGGGAELVPFGSGEYRERFETDRKRIQKLVAPDGRPYWLFTDRLGTQFRFGYTRDSRQDDPTAPDHVFAWHLDSVIDTNGNGYAVSYFNVPRAT